MHSEEKNTGQDSWFSSLHSSITSDLIRIYESTNWTSNIKDTYKNIVDTLYEVLDAEEVYLHLLDIEGNVFSRCASHKGTRPIEGENAESWKVGLGRSRQLIVNKRPQILNYASPHEDDVLPYDEKRYSICIPLTASTEVLGICTVTYYEPKNWTDDDMDYFSVIGFIIGSAIHRLTITDRVAEMAVLNERKRLGSEIHDNVVQFIHAISLNAAAAIASHEEGSEKDLMKNLERLEENCKKTVKVFRDEMMTLRAPIGCARVTGFVDSVQKILDNFERNWGIKTSLVIDTENCPLYTSTVSAIQLTRILNESLSNILRHSQAKNVRVSIEEDNTHLVMTVTDDGVGFDVDKIGPNHWGLKIMEERADSIMGKLRVESVHGGGSSVIADIPRHP